jgi:deazaflavin-dependent oxidoreductase (nitroreductase family)
VTRALEEIMANSAPRGASDYSTKIIEECRANKGRVGGPWADTTLILIHHIGAKSGIERVSPLGCFPLGCGRFAIVASSGGSPTHPDWYHNHKANPRINAEVGTQTFAVLAEGLDGTARAALWPKLVGSFRQRIPGQDHATDSSVHADPPGLTCDESRRSATLGSRGRSSIRCRHRWLRRPARSCAITADISTSLEALHGVQPSRGR